MSGNIIRATMLFLLVVSVHAGAEGLEQVRTAADGAGPDIILVHGLNSNASMWSGVIPRLPDEYDIWTFQYPEDGSVADSASMLKVQINAQARNLSNIVIIAHSMGGLVSRYYIEKLDGHESVSRLVMIATPNGGSHLAGFLTQALDTYGELQQRNTLWDALFPTLNVMGDSRELIVELMNGNGAAYQDLSRWAYRAGNNQFLDELNDWFDSGGPDRAWPEYHVIAGSSAVYPQGITSMLVDIAAEAAFQALSGLKPAEFSIDDRSRIVQVLLPELFNGRGDIAVSLESALLPGVPYAIFPFNHMQIYEEDEVLAYVNEILKGTLDAAGHARVKSALAIVLDSSGSMAKNDGRKLRQAASRLIFSASPADSHIGLIDFDGEANLLASGPPWSDRLAAGIQKIDDEGRTNIGRGILEAYSYLDSVQAERKGIILLSDGRSDPGVDVTKLRSQGLPVYTISLGIDIDRPLMQSIAEATGGYYLHAVSDQEIISRLYGAFNRIRDLAQLYVLRSMIQPGQVIPFSFIVGPDVSAFSVFNSWQGSDLDVSLTAPDGTVYKPTTEEETWEILELIDPLEGTWTGTVTAVDVPEDGEPFELHVNASSPLKARLDYERKTWSRRQPIPVEVTFEGAGAATVTAVEAILQAPDGSFSMLDLPNDASSVVIDGLSESGVYTLDVNIIAKNASGHQFTRHASGTLVVGGNTYTANLGYVQRVDGIYVWVSMGSVNGLREGMKVNFFDRLGQPELASGIAIEVHESSAMIELGAVRIEPSNGQFVRVDPMDWTMEDSR